MELRATALWMSRTPPQGEAEAEVADLLRRAVAGDVSAFVRCVSSRTPWGRRVERWFWLGLRRGYALAGVGLALAIGVGLWYGVPKPKPPAASGPPPPAAAAGGRSHRNPEASGPRSRAGSRAT